MIGKQTSFLVKQPDYRLLATDLDGTLLNSKGELSQENLDALQALGRKGILRVIATGRSLFSFRRVLPFPDIPVDFLICSSGAGIVDLRTGELVLKHHLRRPQIEKIAGILIDQDISFTIQAAMPHSHNFHFREGRAVPADFRRRLSAYEGYGQALDAIGNVSQASHFLAILDGGVDQFNALKERLQGLHVVRTTSPMDHSTIWMEVFPPTVGKGKALEWLVRKFGLAPAEVVAIGNDFNDLEMLRYAGVAYVPANAPLEMRLAYDVLGHHDLPVLPEVMARLDAAR